MIGARIGLAGCGRMGRPMLVALREAGFDASGFDLRPPSEFGELAFAVTDDPAEFAERLEILVSCVRDAEQTEALLFDGQALVARAEHLRWIVLTSTLSPRYARDLRDRVPAHIRLVDAPVAGTEIAARRKELSFMLGASIGDLDHLHPLFTAMGRRFDHMGPYGAGMSAAALGSLVAAANAAVTRLALDWAAAAGLDERALMQLFDASLRQSWPAAGSGQTACAEQGYAPDNIFGLLEKDVASALDTAPEGADTSLPRAVRDAIRGLTPRS